MIFCLLRCGKLIESRVEYNLGTADTRIRVALDGTALRDLELLEVLTLDQGDLHLALFYLFLLDDYSI